MANLYQDILAKSKQQNTVGKQTDNSRTWLRNQASQVSAQRASKEARSQMVSSGKTRITIGNMYMFQYSPKTEKNLPYYDTFPVIFPFDKAPGGFYGINMHYLPHILRAKLMDGLYTLVNNDKYDETTKLQQLSYRILKSASRFKYFEPCVKRYLNSHVTSRFIYVNPAHWEIALFLPLEQFQKATTQKVHSDSIKKIEHNK